MKSEDVKTTRVQLGLSQEKFAKLLGVSWRTVWRWEHGDKMSPLAQRRLEEVRNESRGNKSEV